MKRVKVSELPVVDDLSMSKQGETYLAISILAAVSDGDCEAMDTTYYGPIPPDTEVELC